MVFNESDITNQRAYLRDASEGQRCSPSPWDADSLGQVSSLGIATVTNQHKFCGLTQHKLITWWFCRLEFWSGSHRANIQVSVELHCFLDAPEKNPFLCLFQNLEATWAPWHMAIPPASKSSALQLSDDHSIVVSSFYVSYKHPCNYTGSPRLSRISSLQQGF